MWILFFILILIDSPQSFGATTPTKCAQALLHTNFISYLNQLLDNQTIGKIEIQRLIDGLKQDQLNNPISEAQSNIYSDLQIHREEIQNYIDTNTLQNKEILEWAENILNEKTRIHEKKNQAREVTAEIFQKMELHPVLIENRLIEVMSTPVTQKQWVDLMGINPSGIKGGKNSFYDYPVEYITWWSAIAFANKLSEKFGYEPVYDLTDIEFEFNASAEAEAGQLKSKVEWQEIKIKNTNGFRLPTDLEQKFLLQAAESVEDLKDYAWTNENSNKKTHPVGELKPTIINGRAFYDLFGNVWEWGQDWNVSPKISLSSMRAVRGGSFCNSLNQIGSSRDKVFKSEHRFGRVPFKGGISVGFRLVRTLHLKEQGR